MRNAQIITFYVLRITHKVLIKMRNLRIAMAQINSSVGDLTGNTRKILEFIKRAKHKGAELVTFPELSITGYPPEDLLLKPTFIDANLSCLQKIVDASEAITVVVGFVDAVDDIYNAAAIILTLVN
jgi:NAD+ synthase (glutamine-hydrolysing)